MAVFKEIRILKITLLLMVLYSCDGGHNAVADHADWEIVTIISENRVKVTVENYEDSSIVIFYHKGSFFKPVKNTTIDTIKVWFTKSERDSLALLSETLIAKPSKNSSYCTEFVGALKLVIQSKQVVRTIVYNNVCDWTKLSDETIRLHSILKRKIKRVYLGDND